MFIRAPRSFHCSGGMNAMNMILILGLVVVLAILGFLVVQKRKAAN